ncbi:MAG: ATP-binding protein [Nevskia sp.]|nr:ATP-binding protein [Nevskia sp.]
MTSGEAAGASPQRLNALIGRADRSFFTLLLAQGAAALLLAAAWLIWPAAGISAGWRLAGFAGCALFECAIVAWGCRLRAGRRRAKAVREAGLEAARRDIERQMTERTQQLATAKAQYQALLENINAVPWELDTGNYSCLYIGPQAERLWGWSPAQFAQPGFLIECVHPEDRATLKQALARPEAMQKTAVEYRLRSSDGRTVYVRSELSSGAPAGPSRVVRGISLDVTQQKIMEVELQQAQKLESVGRLASGVAHEINTPVQFVNDSCHFLKDGLADFQTLLGEYRDTLQALAAGTLTPAAALEKMRQRETAADVDYLMENMPGAVDLSLEGLQRVSTIVRSMKDFAHPDQKEKTLADLNQAIQSTLTIARNEYKYVAEIKTELGDIPQVYCFLGDLNQAILNIVVNAAHAIEDVVRGSNRKGEIRIGTRRDGDDVVISIGDTGTGIPEHIRAKIFDPFFTTKEVGKGTGQGLAIARNVVVDKHQGELRFDSAPGQGTTFHLRLPIKPREADEQKAAA